MAKITRITKSLAPLFRIKSIEKLFEDAISDVDKKALETLKYMGEKFVNDARVKGNYNDRTGNLRSSIGYIIISNGQILDRNFETSEKGSDRATGKREAEDFANEMALRNPKGLLLIGVAGMEYAVYVERRHHLDVISGSVPDDEFFKSIMNEINV